MLVLAFGYDAAANRYRRATARHGRAASSRATTTVTACVELVGDDFRFRGLFTCGACGAPADPHLALRAHALRGRHARRSRRGSARTRAGCAASTRARRSGDAALVKGALTPYVADLCLLDRCGAGFRLVRAALRRGELDRRTPFDVSPLGART